MRNSLLVLASFVAAVAAQGVKIVAPAANTTLTLGETFVIDVERPDSLTGSQEVAIAIGIQSCGQSCDNINTAGDIGRPLYSGLYTPTIVGNGRADLAQNFTVQLPDNIQTGAAVLAVAHFALIIGTEPFLEVVNQVVEIQP
ncbi:hypothetical protein BD311DRAFT_90906 [Dichomitus squalens]|uniref:Uncharacterized protein n=1 Tax=Dichomitus squalens TaxID=114155 RepID=A0A4Q9M8E0_9APHY|nr:hypothetical protein BD311DRAFT_90906 [Dichomitus squalens]